MRVIGRCDSRRRRRKLSNSQTKGYGYTTGLGAYVLQGSLARALDPLGEASNSKFIASGGARC
jgi:hypothetical protein